MTIIVTVKCLLEVLGVSLGDLIFHQDCALMGWIMVLIRNFELCPF